MKYFAGALFLLLSLNAQAATRNYAVGVSSSSAVTNQFAALSGIIHLSDDLFIHPMFSWAQVDPVELSVGGLVKHTIFGTRYSGIHIGGGLGFGAAATGAGNAFFFNLNFVGGIHFNWPNAKEIMIGFDVGPSLRILSGNADFEIQPHSASLLGLNIHYFFN